MTTWTRSPNRPTEPGGCLLPQQGRRLAGLAGADLQDRPPHELLHFAGRAAGQQPAAVDQGQAIAALGLVEIGGGDEDRHLLAEQLIEDPPEIAARDGIDAVGRLVEEEHLGRVDRGAGEAEFLFHAAGEIARQAAPKRRQVAEGQQPLGLLPPPAARHVVDVGVEVEVLHHGQVGVQPETLAHVADVFLDRLGLADDVPAGHPGVAGRRVHDGRQQPHGGRLAGAVGPDQAEDFPLRHVEVQIDHGGQIAERLRQVFRADHGHKRKFGSRKSEVG